MILKRLWESLKTYGLVIAAGAASVLMIAVRVLISRNSTLKKQRDEAKDQADYARSVLETDIEVNEQEDVRLKELKTELNNGGVSKELEAPNEDW